MSSVEILKNKISTIEYRIDKLESGVVVPAFVPSGESASVDLSGVESKITALDVKVEEVKGLSVLVDSLSVRMDSMEMAMQKVLARLEALEEKPVAVVEGTAVDLAPLEARVAALEEKPEPEHEVVDLAPLEARVLALEEKPEPEHEVVDLAPLEASVLALEEKPEPKLEVADLAPLEARVSALEATKETVDADE